MVARKGGAVRQGYWTNPNSMCIEITTNWDHRAELDADDNIVPGTKIEALVNGLQVFGDLVHMNSNTDFIITVIMENFAFPRTGPSGGMAAGDITELTNYLDALVGDTHTIGATGGWYANNRSAGLAAGNGEIASA